MNAEELRYLSLETSMRAVSNISASDHSGLVTLEMRHGVVQRVWCGTTAGVLVWHEGKTLRHILQNVEQPLEHG